MSNKEKRFLTKCAGVGFFIALLFGCGAQNNQPKIQVTHVLAVTEQGDTLRLPISMIKPNVYYNVISYPNRYYSNWYSGYYQPGYNNYRPIYAPSGDLVLTITIIIIIINLNLSQSKDQRLTL